MRVWDLTRRALVGDPLPGIRAYALAIPDDGSILAVVGSGVAVADLSQLPKPAVRQSSSAQTTALRDNRRPVNDLEGPGRG